MEDKYSQFMIQEYDQIAKAYFGLRDSTNEWFKSYITLIGFPLTILAAVVKISGGDLNTSLFNLPEIVSGLLLLVSFLGLFVTFSIISMRMEMILYARTINCVRRYFIDIAAHDNSNNLERSKYLILPTSDSKPPFYEAWRAMFWQVILIGSLDSVIAAIALNSLIRWNLLWNIPASILILIIHILVYWLMANQRKNEWNIHFTKDIQASTNV